MERYNMVDVGELMKDWKVWFGLAGVVFLGMLAYCDGGPSPVGLVWRAVKAGIIPLLIIIFYFVVI